MSSRARRCSARANAASARCAGRERREHPRGRRLRVVLAQHGGGERIPAQLVVAQRRAPLLQLAARSGDLPLGARQLSLACRHLGESDPRRVADQAVLRGDLRHEPAEEPLGLVQAAGAQREHAAVVHQVLGHTRHPATAGLRLRGGELLLGLGPVAPAHRQPREALARDHRVLEEAELLRLREGGGERRLRRPQVAGGGQHFGPVLTGDHPALAVAETVMQHRGALVPVGGGGQVAGPKRQHAEPAVCIGQAVAVPGERRLRQHLAQGDLRLAQPAAGLELVAAPGVEPRE